MGRVDKTKPVDTPKGLHRNKGFQGIAGYRDGTLMITGAPSNSPLNWVINLVALEALVTG